jgi:OTU domain-containing protein 5
MAGDGNCLFRSFSDQLYGTPEHHDLVRRMCAEYIASERNYFEQFVAEPFNQFLERIQRDGEWGDDVEIEALSEIYDCRVEIYDSYNHSLMRTFHEACQAQRPTPIRLQYQGRAHYNSVAPANGLVPIAKSMGFRPGDLEDVALNRSRRRHGRGRYGALEADAEQTELEMTDNVLKESRRKFEHKQHEEMDRVLDESRNSHMDGEVVSSVVQDSIREFDQQEQMRVEDAVVAAVVEQSRIDIDPIDPEEEMVREIMHQSAKEAPQYPASVFSAMSSGFSFEQCVQAYELVGDSEDDILQYLYQNL